MSDNNSETYKPTTFERRVLLAAFVVPVAIFVINRLIAVDSEVGAPPTTILGAVAGCMFVFAACLSPLRPTLIAVGVALLSRLSFPIFLVIAAVCGLFTRAANGGELALVVSLWSLLLAIAAVSKARRIDARQAVFRGVVVGINVVFLIILDVLVGVFVLPQGSHDSVSVIHEPNLGWKLRPNATIERRIDGSLSAVESTNSLGFRSKEFSIEKPAGVTRIVVLGDSHTEAYEVNDRETWFELLENRLGENYSIEVIPFGVGGWSTDQQLLAYLYYARQFSPDIVVLQVTHNDVAFNTLDAYWRGRKPWFERHGEVLMLRGVPTPNFRNTGLFTNDLLTKSSLLLAVETVLRRLDIERAVTQEADMEEAWHTTELLIRDLKSIVQNDGARLIAFMADSQRSSETRFKQIFHNQKVPYLESRGAYTDEFDTYWIGTHWNKKGQDAVANWLLPQIEAHMQNLK